MNCIFQINQSTGNAHQNSFKTSFHISWAQKSSSSFWSSLQIWVAKSHQKNSRQQTNTLEMHQKSQGQRTGAWDPALARQAPANTNPLMLGQCLKDRSSRLWYQTLAYVFCVYNLMFPCSNCLAVWRVSLSKCYFLVWQQWLTPPFQAAWTGAGCALPIWYAACKGTA